jgi:flagellar basal body L-ring protein FlgH
MGKTQKAPKKDSKKKQERAQVQKEEASEDFDYQEAGLFKDEKAFKRGMGCGG